MLNSTTNTFDSVIDRVSVDVTGRSDDPVTLTIGRDSSAIESAVSDFVNAFNSLSSRIGQLTAYNSETQAKGVLLGDSAALELRRAIFTTVQGRARGVEGGFFALSQVGVTSAQGGQLQFDAAKLRAALEQDPEGVASVFAAFEQAPRDERIEVSPGIFVNNTASAEYSRLGVAELVVQLADRYLSPTDGLLSRRRQAIDGQNPLPVFSHRADRPAASSDDAMRSRGSSRTLRDTHSCNGSRPAQWFVREHRFNPPLIVAVTGREAAGAAVRYLFPP